MLMLQYRVWDYVHFECRRVRPKLDIRSFLIRLGRPKCFGLVASKFSSVADLPFDDEFHAARLASEEVGA
ncbi:unnamed protein product [Cochlearia groenlandica]